MWCYGGLTTQICYPKRHTLFLFLMPKDQQSDLLHQRRETYRTVSSSHPPKNKNNQWKSLPFPFDFFALYMLYLKYVIFTDERKSITVAAKNVTLSAKLFFLTTEPYKKMPLNPYSYWAPCR